jgi:putative acetyltransferase
LSGSTLRIRAFQETDATRVRELFILINRALAPTSMKAALEEYIARALVEELDRIAAYYREKDGGFWVGLEEDRLVGTFGLERVSSDAMELRRMYVDPGSRRRGIGSQMLRYAENQALQRSCTKLVLSTADFQTDAIRLYERACFEMTSAQVAVSGSHKTLGSGVRRLHYEKRLAPA